MFECCLSYRNNSKNDYVCRLQLIRANDVIFAPILTVYPSSSVFPVICKE